MHSKLLIKLTLGVDLRDALRLEEVYVDCKRRGGKSKKGVSASAREIKILQALDATPPLAPFLLLLLLLLHVAINQVAVPVVVVVVVACCLRCVSGVSSCCVLCTWHVALSKLNPPPPLPP